MPATMIFENLIVHSIDSDILAIYAHGGYIKGKAHTTVPLSTKIIWHSRREDWSVLPRGQAFIKGRPQTLKDFGTAVGGTSCENYVLSADLDLKEREVDKQDPENDLRPTIESLAREATTDWARVNPYKRAYLSTVFDAILNRRLNYRRDPLLRVPLDYSLSGSESGSLGQAR